MGFLTSKRGKIIVATSGIVVLALIITLIIWISLNGFWPVARDIALVVLALLSFVPILALTYAIIQVGRTAAALRRELTPIAQDVRETTKSVRETVKAAGDFAVKPGIRIASSLVGIAQVFSVILGQGTAARKRAERRRHQQDEQAQEQQEDAAVHSMHASANRDAAEETNYVAPR